MTKDAKSTTKVIYDHGPMGWILFVAWAGSLVYFVHDAKDFGQVLWGIIESIVWPGIVMYHVLGLLGA